MKCPKCGAEIDHLVQWCTEEVPYEMRILEDGTINYQRSETLEPEPKDEPVTYCCPECEEVLTSSEKDAVTLFGMVNVNLN